MPPTLRCPLTPRRPISLQPARKLASASSVLAFRACDPFSSAEYWRSLAKNVEYRLLYIPAELGSRCSFLIELSCLVLPISDQQCYNTNIKQTYSICLRVCVKCSIDQVRLFIRQRFLAVNLVWEGGQRVFQNLARNINTGMVSIFLSGK